MTESGKNNGIFYSLFESLREKIPYVVLRNYDDLPEKPLKGSDIDLLIGKKDREKYLLILKEVVVKTGSFILAKYDQPNCLSCFVYQKTPLNSGVWLDVFTEISSKSFIWADSGFLLRNRRQHQKGFFIPLAGGEAATLFVKEIFSQSFIKERYRLKIPDLARNDRQNFIKILDPYFGEKTIREMLDLCLKGEWAKAIKKRNILFFTLVLKNFWRRPFGQMSAFLSFTLGYLKKIMSLKGLTVTLIGPDGVGKTTACQRLKEDLKNLPYKKIYEYHGHFGFFPEWGKVYRWILRKEENKKEVLPREKEKIGLLRAFLSILYYGLEHFLAWPWILWLKIRGNLVIFDRYFYDFVTLDTSSKLSLKLFWFLVRFIHRPDLTFVMNAAPETIYGRKKELSLGEIKRQSGLFGDGRILKLTSAVMIDGEESQTEVSARMKEEILKTLSKKI